MALASIHTGIGHSHIEGIFSIIGLPSIAHRSFKDRKRKVGTAMEEVAKDSCHKWKLEEQKTELELIGTKSLKGCYDISWINRSGMYNPSSRSGCIIGYNTGKCIDFATRNKDCRFCSVAAQKGAQPNPHDCRKNFSGSSKTMESSVCEELFRKEQYKVMVTDEDASSEARIKSQVNPDIEKWSDINHVVRILGKLLYEAKTTNFGPKNDRLTDQVKSTL